ncbi:MAG: hypothetical protein FJ271_27320 [Planctomycetes bacterium]|nr:hypothetical protein [Planctomycetota bacterium]
MVYRLKIDGYEDRADGWQPAKWIPGEFETLESASAEAQKISRGTLVRSNPPRLGIHADALGVGVYQGDKEVAYHDASY